jgi:succinate dehydrogenase/fumarate reductase flavoprotein subunit
MSPSPLTLDRIATGAVYDVIVLGAGGAGMAAALFAALERQTVLLVERTPLLGGTTALSAGTTWIPGSQHAASVGAAGDTLDKA